MKLDKPSDANRGPGWLPSIGVQGESAANYAFAKPAYTSNGQL